MMKLYINPLLVIVLILIPLKTSAKVLWCENTSTGKKTLTHLFFLYMGQSIQEWTK